MAEVSRDVEWKLGLVCLLPGDFVGISCKSIAPSLCKLRPCGSAMEV